VNLSDLDYDYPADQIATQPQEPCRILLAQRSFDPREIQRSELYQNFKSGDVLVLNDTLVSRRRVFALHDDLEILFVKALSDLQWEVLCPARLLNPGDKIALPGGLFLELISKGFPQRVQSSEPLSEAYFAQWGEVALPPYIQKARNQRHSSAEDLVWYQTAWAKHVGSAAAPTASLHFGPRDLEELLARGVVIRFLTLHVGLGTFLPVRTERLEDHVMHQETVTIPSETLSALVTAKARGQRIWALGTTVARALESYASGELIQDANGNASGAASIFIQPGYEWQMVSGLMTNFHQPKSTLLALVAAFAGLSEMRAAYDWAIARGFRLFSYGDLSVWLN
jgi:S-adenosylmethionine:tRNA ribosyltransferase-isomerase